MDVTLHPDGTLAVADWGNHRIRVVGADGVISTVAGNGELGFSGDGGPATEARINEAYGIAYDGEGRLYIADSTNHRVRRVELDGTIHTVAGVGKPGYGGDGGPAIDAHFDSPQALALRDDGVWIVNDEHNHRLRLLHANGTVTHFAGNGRREWCGDGGPAATACFDDPEGIAFAPDGALWVTDGDNHRVRRIDADGTIATIAGNGPVGKKE